MDPRTILYLVIVGAIAGWLAGQIMRGRSFGLIGNIVIGIIGAVVGGWLFDFFNISIGGGMISSIVAAVAGAVAVLFVAGLFRKK
jgi:uncharacterized membrane protein YeaQ/YmgE (transglycosylase-associated protein family)